MRRREIRVSAGRGRRVLKYIKLVRRLLGRRRRSAAAARFREVVKADVRYKAEWEAEVAVMSMEEVVRFYKLKPAYRNLWQLARHCADVQFCYRAFAYFKITGRDDALDVAREAVRVGADVDLVARLLWEEKIAEAKRLLER